MARPRTVGTLIRNNFADATRHEMDLAHDMKFGSSPAPSLTDDELRNALIAGFTTGEDGKIATAKPPTSNDETPTPVVNGPRTNKIPNLRSTGKWDGRMRRVTFLQQDGSKMQQVQPVGWDGIIWNIPLNVPVDMPWPYWESAQRTGVKDEGSEAVTKWVNTPDGRLEKHVTPVTAPTLRWIDHGDVPGTESLPRDYCEYFHAEAIRTEGFKSLNRSALIMVYNVLHESQPMWHFRDMRDEDIRMKIAMTLGTDIEEILQNQLYAESA